MTAKWLKKPRCAMCQFTEPLGLAKDVSYVIFANSKEYKLCRYCHSIIRKDRRLIDTVFPPEFDINCKTRRAWLVREYDRLNPVGNVKVASSPDLLPSVDAGGAPDEEALTKANPMVVCPACGEAIEVAEDKGGETITCPKCGAKVEVPLTSWD